MSVKHWYARYVGDYQRKTSHLSMVEHGAYTLLLDWYYANEKPIPSDVMQVHRICRSFAPEEKAAVDMVLNHYFTMTKDGWINERVAKELENKKEISLKRKDAASKRWCKSNANAYAKGNAKSMLSTTTTTLIEKNKQKRSDFAGLAESDFSAWAEKNNLTHVNIVAEIEKCSDWHKSNGKVVKDAKAAVRNWIRRSAEYNPAPKPKGRIVL